MEHFVCLLFLSCCYSISFGLNAGKRRKRFISLLSTEEETENFIYFTDLGQLKSE